jgi:hypothetical protein
MLTMSEISKGASDPKDAPTEVAQEAKPISFAEFLEATPPSQEKIINDLFTEKHSPAAGRSFREVQLPALILHCSVEGCNGTRTFRRNSGDLPRLSSTVGEEKDLFLTYICSNCRMRTKIYSVRLIVTSEEETTFGSALKFGERPAFGPPTPTRLLKLLGEQREIFLKGRRCENQGLGVGAFAYYRRVVEHQKNRILDEIIKVSEKLGADKDLTKLLDTAKAETQFSKSISLVKDAIPQTLLINGHNPLTLLHGALSVGLHEQSDERCLELAHDIRVVLAELSERLSQALKDEVELNTAVTRLLQAKTV